MWDRFLEVKDGLPDNAGRGGIGTPDQVREHLARCEAIGVDQIIFVQQSGRNRHDHICESLELFARTLLPEFQARETERQARKQAELAPHIAAALARRERMAPLDEDAVRVVEAFGRQGAKVGVTQASTFNDRGGAISVPRSDPHAGTR